MLNETLKPITEILGKTPRDFLNEAINNRIDLYTVIKRSVIIYYDYIEVDKCDDDVETIIIVSECDKYEAYSRHDVIKIPTPALKEIWVNKKLNERTLNLLFEPPTSNHKVHSIKGVDVVTLDDVYVDTTNASTKNLNARTRKEKAPHIRAIEVAISELGENATNESIYNWIKKETNNPKLSYVEFISQLNFNDIDVDPYSITMQNCIIFKYNGKPVTKQNFQDICSRIRKR